MSLASQPPISPMGDQVTLGEVDRNVKRIEAALNNLHNKLDRLLDTVVTKESLEKEVASIRHEIGDLEKEIEYIKDDQYKRNERVRTQRNLMLAALIYPTILLFISQFLNIYLLSRHK